MSVPSTPSIELHGFSYNYPDGHQALGELDITILEGEAVALVGPNGAGKSTLLWGIGGLLPLGAQSRRTGSARVAGSELTERDGADIRRKLGILFQDPDDQLFGATIVEDVAFGLRCLGEDSDSARRKALGALARVGLLEVAERAPQKLSYGERKRACLAGLLAYSPSIYLLDEPTANLDPRSRRQLIELIKTSATTRLIATHDLELALALCPRSIVLDAGRIVADGPTPTLLADETLMESHGLEVPLSLALARCT